MLQINLFRRFVTRASQTRCYSEAVALSPSASTQRAPLAVQYPYYVPRNSRGSLPVYTDIRNAGGKYLVLLRNIDGDVNALVRDLRITLFEPGSPEATRLTIKVKSQKHLVISGGRWKEILCKWLQDRGF